MIFLFNAANIITLFRIIVSVFIVFPITYYKYHVIKKSYLTIFLIGLFFLSDFFDGFIARKYNQQTEIGKHLDPIADKISFLSTLIPLSINKIIPAPITFLLILRDIMVSGIRQINHTDSNQNIINPSSEAKAKTMILMTGITASYSNYTYHNSTITKNIFIVGLILSIYSCIDYIKKSLN